MIHKETSVQKSLRDQIEVVFRRRWLLIFPLAGIVLISLVVSIALPSIYEATTTVRINDRKIIDPLVSGVPVSPDGRSQFDMLTKQIVSWSRLDRLAEQFHMKENVESEAELEQLILGLKKRITVVMKDKDMIEISFEDSDPAVAQQVVNTITNSFISESSMVKRQEARNAIEFINEQLKIYRERLEKTQRNVSTHKLDTDLRIALTRKKLLESQLNNMQRVLPSLGGSQSSVIGRLQSHLAELETELARLMMDAKEGNPRVASLKNEIERVKSTINAEIRKETARDGLSSVNPQFAQIEQELKAVNMEIEDLQKQKEQLGSGEDGGDAPADKETATLETSQRVDEDIYRMLLGQIESAYVSERLQDSDKGSAFSVVEYARLPVSPTKPQRGLIMLFGLFMGAFSGFGLVFLMEYIDTSFRTSDDAKKHLNIQFLGSISRMVLEEDRALSMANRFTATLKNFLQRHHIFSGIRLVSPHVARNVITGSGISPQVVIFHEPKSPIAEEYRIVRTNIQGLSEESTMKIIMLTSSVRGEGKSTTSTNLAVATAGIGRNTLLIDADLRRGTVHDLLNVSQSPGLSDVLGKNVSIDVALVETRIRNLTVLPCGNRPANPSELLGSRRMEQLIDTVTSRFDAIIVDAPPVIHLPDASILGKHCDGVIMLVQAERTQREDVVRAHSMLVQARSNIVGFIMSNVQYHIPKYVYDYLYGT